MLTRRVDTNTINQRKIFYWKYSWCLKSFKNTFPSVGGSTTTEDSGHVYAAQLVYSGNFTGFVEVTPLETCRWGMGLNDEQFSWELSNHSNFQTPEVLLSFTDKGLTGMTQDSHEFIKIILLLRSLVIKNAQFSLTTGKELILTLLKIRL